MTKLLFTSDLHGDKNQYDAVVRVAKIENVQALFIGGDLTPPGAKTIDDHASFFKKDFSEFISKLAIPTYSIMGNHDLKVHIPLLQEMQTLYPHFTYLNNEIKPFENQTILGYSSVPFTPCALKDWEKRDVYDIPEETLRSFNRRGELSIPEGFEKITVNTADTTSCIQSDLENLLQQNQTIPDIWLIHTPPYNTHLDKMFDGKSVGSLALRRCIEKYQPKITLHGHIHETVNISGEYIQHIGKTVCLTAGNHPDDLSLSYLVVDTRDPSSAKRYRIRTTFPLK